MHEYSTDVRDRAAEAARKVDRDYGHWQDWVGSIDEFEHERALSTVDAVVAVVAPEIERPLQARIEELEAMLCAGLRDNLPGSVWDERARAALAAGETESEKP